jgi:hypothetical protein
MLLGVAGINTAYFAYKWKPGKLKYLEGNMWAIGNSGEK